MSAPGPAPRPVSGRAPAFAFSRRRGGSGAGAEVQGREGLANPPSPMAPTAFWAALAVGLQFWAAGRAVPAQVGDSPRRGRHPTHLRLGARPPPPGHPDKGAGLRAMETGSDACAFGDLKGTSGLAHVRPRSEVWNSGHCGRGSYPGPSVSSAQGVGGRPAGSGQIPARLWTPAPVTPATPALPRVALG